jgi:hypothetical protein
VIIENEEEKTKFLLGGAAEAAQSARLAILPRNQINLTGILSNTLLKSGFSSPVVLFLYPPTLR